MRALWLLMLSLLTVWAQDLTATNAPATSLNELLNMLERVDNELMSSVKEDYTEAQKKRDALKLDIGQQIKDQVSLTLNQYQQKIEEVNQMKIDLQNQWETEKQIKMQEFERRLAEAEKAFNDARQIERDAIKKQIEAERQAYINAEKKRETQKKQQIEDLQNYVDQLKGVYQQHINDQKAEKQKRIDDLMEKGSSFYKQYMEKKAQLDNQGAQLKKDIAEYSSKKMELDNLLAEGLRKGSQALMAEKSEGQLQQRLNEEMKEVMKEDLMKKMHPEGKGEGPSEASVVASAPKATSLLDTLTGASAWETVSWVLLGLCILLSIALIAMIIYQVFQHGNYNKINGVNRPLSERAPFYPGNTAPPLPYTQDKHNGSAPGTSAVTMPPDDQTQQF